MEAKEEEAGAFFCTDMVLGKGDMRVAPLALSLPVLCERASRALDSTPPLDISPPTERESASAAMLGLAGDRGGVTRPALLAE